MTKTINIGILAHVDAGKTSLTERLLYDAGVIDTPGSVDSGDTQTDSLALERKRGITIRSAVADFQLGDVKVNIIDTPGHPDFIAEVERALTVLDGVILVVSAVEGVQAQTRLLLRTLIAMGMPVILFVNKIDRVGARGDALLASIRAAMNKTIVELTSVADIGTPLARVESRDIDSTEFAEVLADNDDAFAARYLDDELVPGDNLAELARQAQTAALYPVLFGSAMHGIGIDTLVTAITGLLPVETADSAAAEPLRATVFKIERGRAGEKVAYLRMLAGRLEPRDKVRFFRPDGTGAIVELNGRVTSVEVVGGTVPATPGDIAKLRGLKDIRIGDQLGTAEGAELAHRFAPPSLATVVKASRADGSARLYEALLMLADQDPFIGVANEASGEISVRLYGEVQKEVIKDMLAADYGIEVEFAATDVVCVERPSGAGESLEEMGEGTRTYFWATIGLRVEPGEPDSGIVFRRAVELGSLPYAFHKAIDETVRSTLRQGLYGWPVRDILVTLTRSGYASPLSAAGDFRNLTPLVLMSALRQAGTQVLEPITQFNVDTSLDSAGQVLAGIVACGGLPNPPRVNGERCWLDGTIATRHVRALTGKLPGLSQGEAAMVTRLDGFAPVVGPPPTRPRTDANPLNRDEYLLRVLKPR